MVTDCGEIATSIGPAAKCDFLADVRGANVAAVIGAHGVRIPWVRVFRWCQSMLPAGWG